MKKKILACVMAALLFLGNIVFCPELSQAAMSKKKQHKMYEEVVRKYDKEMNKERTRQYKYTYFDDVPEYEVSRRTYFCFADIDDNGIDECIMRFGGKNEDNTAEVWDRGDTTTIYTISNGKVKPVLRQGYMPRIVHYGGVCIYKNRSMIATVFISMTERHLFFRYKNGKIENGKIKSADDFYISNDYGYELSWDSFSGSYVTVKGKSKTVSKKTRQKIYKKLTNNETGYKMHVYKKSTFNKYI